MVCLGITKECSNGDHGLCKGGYSPPPGHFGGLICQCDCHKDFGIIENNYENILKAISNTNLNKFKMKSCDSEEHY